MQIYSYNFKSEMVRYNLYVFSTNLLWEVKLCREKPDQGRASMSLHCLRILYLRIY
jgi:hypothetical protein